MPCDTPANSGLAAKTSHFLERHSGKTIIGAVVLTVLLVIPLLAMEPGESASRDPSGEVFELQDDLDARFQSAIHPNSYVVESRDQDMLTQASLWELYQNTQRLLAADAEGELAPKGLPSQPYLYRGFDLNANRPILGVSSIADSVQLALSDPRVGLSLEGATDDHVKLALHFLLSSPTTSGLKEFLSVKARSEKRTIAGFEIDYWTSPALLVNVLADNDKLGGGASRAGLSVDDTVIDKERFARKVQDVLRGDEETYRLWGIAIDQNLEAEDEGRTAGVFIMFTIIAALLVVGLSLRSYWAVALTGVGLGAMIIWLEGISNLVGLKSDLIIDLIVPIAMISLGVDFAIHAVRRYQEERAAGYPPARALAVGFAGVLGALVLAMLSDGIAFLSNASSGIEAVIHFGLSAGIAVASSFIVLGIVVPLALVHVETVRGGRPPRSSVAARAMELARSAGVAALCATSVLLLVVGFSAPGLVVLLATATGFLVLPWIVLRRRRRRGPHLAASALQQESPVGDAHLSLPVTLVTGLARHRFLVLPAMALVTAAAVFMALKLDAQLDVKDFFDSESDFVVSLDKLDEHIGERGGEPAVIYVQGDLADPQALSLLRQLVGRLAENPYVGRDSEGAPSIWRANVLNMLKELTSSPYAREQVERATGVGISDADGDGVPDSRGQVRAAYDYMVEGGVPRDKDTLIWDAGQVRATLFHRPDGGEKNVTTLQVGIPGTREQATVEGARKALAKDLDVLRGSPLITRFGLTGSPFVREAQLDATTATLQRSIPIAAAASLVLLLVAMRSLRYAVVTIIPIGLVVAWLYALMYLMGFSLNFVTATIGAVSIGVGIDYSIYMTERFRGELARSSNATQALQRAVSGTGVALLGSAASSIVGFTILGLAPMPMFSSYGYLTAIMIFLALAASLIVLPSLLLLVTPATAPHPDSSRSSASGSDGPFVDTS